jgi:hypothetical protein
MFYSVANIVFFTFIGSCNLLPAIHRGQLPLRGFAYGIPFLLAGGALSRNCYGRGCEQLCCSFFFMHFHSPGSELPGVAMHKKGTADAMPSSILFS